jgi:Glycosyl hydrolase catalytic core
VKPRRRLSLALLACALLVAAIGVPAHSQSTTKPAIGIAEQIAPMFGDPRFKELKITHARIDTAWDVLRDPAQTTAFDAYLQAAHQDNVDVLITFDHSRLENRKSINPTPAQLVAVMQQIRKRWPWVHEFSTWNEVNIAKHPDTVAKWWMAMKHACPTCTVLGGDLLDRSTVSNKPKDAIVSIKVWLKGFLKVTKGRQPAIWGLHNYTDANNFRTDVTTAMLAAVKGRVWLTETGGLVARHNHSPFKLPQGLGHAANATKFILTKLDRVSSRIQRVYLYQWDGATTTWDSGLINGQGMPRPSLTYLRRFLTGK